MYNHHISLEIVLFLIANKEKLKKKRQATDDNITRRMRIACWIPKATNTHSEFIIHLYSALRPVLAGTRTQSGDRYGSGTLHPGQVLRGRLPLLPPAFRRSHLLR